MQSTKIGVLIRTYDKYKANLAPLVESLRSAVSYIVVGYDLISSLPENGIQEKCDKFFLYHGVGNDWARKQESELYLQKTGLKILELSECDYALTITGDVKIENPGGIVSLLDVLGDNDLIAGQWWNICGTLIMFGKVHELYKIFCDVPSGFPQFEIKTTRAIRRNSIQYEIHKCTSADQGIWGDLIGYKRGINNYSPDGVGL
jgi:hypothetical protein